MYRASSTVRGTVARAAAVSSAICSASLPIVWARQRQHGGGRGPPAGADEGARKSGSSGSTLKALARLAAHSLSHIIFGRETYMAEGRKIASAASRNDVIAGPVKH